MPARRGAGAGAGARPGPGPVAVPRAGDRSPASDPASGGVLRTGAPRVPGVTVRVPAKVNLFLGCGPLRDDGYHELATVFHALSLYDEVTVSPADELALTVVGEGAGVVPLDGDNLAARAAVALAARAGVEPTVRIDIRKGIPVAGGLAGGSADAAATLVACEALWGLDVGRPVLDEVAAGLGSDVPFLLHGGTALGCGRGERLTPALARGEYHWVLALADGGLSTPAVYGELDRIRAERAAGAARGHGPGISRGLDPAGRCDAVLAALRSGDPRQLGPALGNDLQPAAVRLRPALRRTLEAGAELGALGGIVSGSGPTCAFLARSESAAVDLAAALAGAGVCRTVRRVTGPVHGARVVPPLAQGAG